ncbi:MAG: Maf family protein [Bdellovibrionaceae bacterium]|jgi:septum formation protein|nr:Maf family protein [Pseudobdellovibrionaceae bacterium]
MQKKIVLASQSPYRKKLLSRLPYPFEAVSPQVNEEELKAQWLAQKLSADELARRLAEAKARSVVAQYKKEPELLVLGSDQLLHFQGEIFGKSGSVEKAAEQLMRLQGHTHELVTAMCLMDPSSEKTEVWTVRARMFMYPMSEGEIWDYVQRDHPIDCAGSYKLEEHGISLFSRIDCEDWTAIEGLGLLSLQQRLRHWN